MTAALELSRPLAVERVLHSGTAFTVAADARECAAIAARLMIPAVETLRCDWLLRPGEGGMIEARGTLSTVVTQICVVTLDPFDSTIREQFLVHFVPAGREASQEDPDDPDEIVYEGALIDLGEAAVEQLALVLDPYPRKPGAQLLDLPAESSAGPFDTLAKRRGLD